MVKIFKTQFECDPRKHKDCEKKKRLCHVNGGPCHTTNLLRYAKMDNPHSYAELQARQTADLYARIEVPDKYATYDTNKEAGS